MLNSLLKRFGAWLVAKPETERQIESYAAIMNPEEAALRIRRINLEKETDRALSMQGIHDGGPQKWEIDPLIEERRAVDRSLAKLRCRLDTGRSCGCPTAKCIKRRTP